MVEFPRKADGRRVFSVAFKRETVARITSGEKTLAELLGELGRRTSGTRARPTARSWGSGGSESELAGLRRPAAGAGSAPGLRSPRAGLDPALRPGGHGVDRGGQSPPIY